MIHWTRLHFDLRATILSFLFTSNECPSVIHLLRPLKVKRLSYGSFAHETIYNYAPAPFTQYAERLFATRSTEQALTKTPCIRAVFRGSYVTIESSDDLLLTDFMNALNHELGDQHEPTCFTMKTPEEVGYIPENRLPHGFVQEASVNKHFQLLGASSEDQHINYEDLSGVQVRVTELTQNGAHPLTLFFVFQRADLTWQAVRAKLGRCGLPSAFMDRFTQELKQRIMYFGQDIEAVFNHNLKKWMLEWRQQVVDIELTPIVTIGQFIGNTAAAKKRQNQQNAEREISPGWFMEFVFTGTHGPGTVIPPCAMVRRGYTSHRGSKRVWTGRVRYHRRVWEYESMEVVNRQTVFTFTRPREFESYFVRNYRYFTRQDLNGRVRKRTQPTALIEILR
jgi:hypothetical protein